MKIQNFPILMFGDMGANEDTKSLIVPKLSKFLAIKVLHDGIFAWYEIPEVESLDTKTEVFHIVKPGSSVPDNVTFIAILDIIVETPEGQGIMIFPIYKSDSILEIVKNNLIG